MSERGVDRDVEVIPERRDEVILTVPCEECHSPVVIEAKRCADCGHRRITEAEAARMHEIGLALTILLTPFALLVWWTYPLGALTGAVLLVLASLGPGGWLTGRYRLREIEEERAEATERLAGEVLDRGSPDGRYRGGGA